MRLTYRIVNVFTVDRDPSTLWRLSGNPLCVFEDARALSDAQMQALARQTNLSETTFILPSERASARVRIFTPSYEMPFAGHPTLGTAHVIRALGTRGPLVLEVKAGLVPVTAEGDTWTLCAAKAPVTRKLAATRAELAKALGLTIDALAEDPLWVDTGVEQLVVPLAGAAHVRAARPDPALLLAHCHSDTREGAMAYVWAREGDTAIVRFFFEQHGAVIEDPATGSACANLGGWMIATGKPLPLQLALRQGDAVGRPSKLGLRIDADAKIFVTGAVVELGTGVFEL
jgi:PhzF family phenazine biosynthesis protein